MIYSLKGTISISGENTLVVNTGAISFECFCSTNTMYEATKQGGEQTLLTYMQVKEDGISLFGFYTKEEKALFEKLILVSGVGPKMAIGVLSSGSVDSISSAIATGNTKVLSSIKGLGKKTAERICLELKDKLDFAGDLGASFETGTIKTPATDEAIAALISLGLNKGEATSLINTYANREMTAEEIVSVCLKNMGGR